MKKVITYGTYDLLHYGHVRLLERAKALGDYLIVGVTADDFDKVRGKINVQQSLMERIEAVRATGLADEIIVEEYEGQKIDDIVRYNVDIFTVGSDWSGKFDYLNQFCKVVYLERTTGVSSSDLRTKERALRLGLIGESTVLDKFARESRYVNGIEIAGICSLDTTRLSGDLRESTPMYQEYGELLKEVDAVYIVSHPSRHFQQVKQALEQGKHVLCESPIALKQAECEELFQLARQRQCVLMEGIKTAYSTAYKRLLLLVKSGKIGEIVSVDATCTSLQELVLTQEEKCPITWNSICAWGPTALLPVFQLLGTSYTEKRIISKIEDASTSFDSFTKIDFVYPKATASIKVGKGVKSEGELIISGTKGYVYVPAPWWKTDYFELRYENPADNKRYFYQVDGEGIRYEIVAFAKAITMGSRLEYIDTGLSQAIVGVIEEFENGNVVRI